MPTPLMDKQEGRVRLLEVAAILDSLQVPFFLMQGTALGAYRDKGFVPHERDIDFGVLWEHLRGRQDEITHALWKSCYHVRQIIEPFTVCRTIVADIAKVKVDIVGFPVWQDKRFAATPIDRRSVGRKPYAILHDRAMLETWETVELFDRTFNVPSPIEKYLESEYGEGWNTPQDDHISRGREYRFIESKGLPRDYLESESAVGRA